MQSHAPPTSPSFARLPRALAPIVALGMAVIGLLLAFAGSGRWDEARAQDHPSAACGTPATGWSTASVNGFGGTVREISREPDLVGTGTATAAERLVVTLALTNQSREVISLREGTIVAILTCDGEVLSPNAGSPVDPEALDLAPGATLELPLTFNLPAGIQPERVVVRRMDGNRCAGQLGFPLALPGTDAATPTITAGAPTPAANAFASCEGGMATTGASSSATGNDGTTTGGETIPQGQSGEAGGSGSATGGRGGDGEDAVGTGSGARGGDGGDGGAAVSGSSVDVVGADCTPEPGTSWAPEMTS